MQLDKKNLADNFELFSSNKKILTIFYILV